MTVRTFENREPGPNYLAANVGATEQAYARWSGLQGIERNDNDAAPAPKPAKFTP